MMNKLNKAFVDGGRLPVDLLGLEDGWDELPDRVLQFGTGVLLRGLPDYFIDKSNRHGVFNGRVVIVKSTDGAGADEFDTQDGLYTLHVRGLQSGVEVRESILISAISRVLSAAKQWQEILDIAVNPDVSVVISNTTEVGIVFDENDELTASPPASFPAKLTALLYRRFLHFAGDIDKGWVVLPTELIGENATRLKAIVVQLAQLHGLGSDFIRWLDEANDFCNTLVDCIVPGKLPITESQQVESQLGYQDGLAIMSEPFRLWAIESSSQRVLERLSFAQVDDSMVIAPDISKFKELKLRLLNGTHTLSCGLAILSGFTTVKEAMQHTVFARYVRLLMRQEIIPAIIGGDIAEEDALTFADSVIDRFSNPFLNHQWLSISLNYTSKMQMRNVALLERYMQRRKSPPHYMALGFAAYLRFMKCEISTDGIYRGDVGHGPYVINDKQAPYFANLWATHEPYGLVDTVLKDQDLWQVDLSALVGFSEKVKHYLVQLLNDDALDVVKQFESEYTER